MIERKLLFYVITLLVVLVSCKQKVKEPYPGFNKTEHDVYFKRITIGDGKLIPHEGDSLFLKVLFSDTLGNVIFNSNQGSGTGVIGLFLSEKTSNNFFEKALTTMVEGDSTQFIINADSLYLQSFNIQLPSTIKKGSLLYVFAQLFKHKNAEQIAFEKKQYEKWATEMLEIENKKLEEYLSLKKITIKPDSNGIYLLNITQGTGKPIYQYGNVLIYLKGNLLDGTEVENTCPPNQPLEFFSGQAGQVVRAVELILPKLKIGGKATFITSSKWAYGALGSSTGIVHPFTSILYQIEIKAPDNLNSLP
ncbi:MAG: FKBP-type peptidyl-prolyl cis-trans isomerase [Bacteroidia bacterium]|nr:FKBP-type peptidyl-prolyl cis-trans isomerase [Bacteroidia bacterium]